MAETKSIHIGDILTITTGRLVSHDHVGGAYNILDWMTGESLMTHQLPRAADVCKPFLEATFPQLAAIVYPSYLEVDGVSADAIFTWLDTQGELYGEWWDVPKLPIDAYDAKNAIIELAEMIGTDKTIIGVVI